MKNIFFLAVISLFVSCGIQKKSHIKINDETKLIISYNQKSKDNKLPEYSIELFSNRQMYLTATKNLDKNGKYMRIISEKEYNQIINTFVKSDFLSFNNKDTYTEQNVPTHIMYFSNNDKEKTINYNLKSNPRLKELELLIQSFLDRVGWEKMSW